MQAQKTCYNGFKQQMFAFVLPIRPYVDLYDGPGFVDDACAGGENPGHTSKRLLSNLDQSIHPSHSFSFIHKHSFQSPV